MRICIIGNSGHYCYALQGVRENKDLRIVGVSPGSNVDSEQTLRSIATEFSTQYYASYSKMLDHEKPDMVCICTRYDLNADISIECLNRGIHCFTEKSIAHSFEKLEQLSEASQKNGKTIIGMHAMRYSPEFYAAYKAISEGFIGEARLITGQKSYGFGYNRPEFYKDRSTYGGSILWVSSHALDWTYWIMGEFKTLYALQNSDKNLGYGSCEMTSIIAFSFPNGALGTIHSDFFQPDKSRKPGDRLRVAGEKGIVTVQDGKAFITTDTREKTELPLEKGDFFGDYCRELQGTGKCRLSMKDTFYVTSLCLLARESADLSGKVVNLKD